MSIISIWFLIYLCRATFILAGLYRFIVFVSVLRVAVSDRRHCDAQVSSPSLIWDLLRPGLPPHSPHPAEPLLPIMDSRHRYVWWRRARTKGSEIFPLEKYVTFVRWRWDYTETITEEFVAWSAYKTQREKASNRWAGNTLSFGSGRERG